MSCKTYSHSTRPKFRKYLEQEVWLVIDQVICGVIVGPLTVFVWWGTWSFLNSHLFPDRLEISGFVCVAIGNCGLLTLAFTQGVWKKYLSVDRTLHWVFGCHFYTVVCLFCNVCHWRGVWTILDYYTGVNLFSCWTTYAIGQCLLLAFRCSKNAQAPPMLVVHDRDVNFFAYTTRFRVTPQLSEKYVFDVVFTVLIIHQLVVFYWRGSWELMDLYIFPDNKTYSAIVSFGIAYGLLILSCIIQPAFNFLFRRYASTKNSYHRFLCSWVLEAVSYFFTNFVSVALWRGVWLICDVYVLPNRPDLAHGVILAAGFVGLWLMMCGHSLAIRGCDLDGETNGDDDAVCMCQNLYVRRFRSLSKCYQPTTGRQDVEKQNNEMTAGDNLKSFNESVAQNGELVCRLYSEDSTEIF